ncbi:zinc ribbon domain-containing protein [Butyrivibrio sp. X503]|uniref:zinc ribbon domain-containing protein n=1 Tax=Butyrivibrio sp. X503 TaxID=2364878 RepID=UPI000EAA21CE|nr:zinc ribbon domain-containing protein [Butyrivibrio sp. X503]RKM54274.1 zinc ribbon domain-containing protein [Butyrivibrio sp. X503]
MFIVWGTQTKKKSYASIGPVICPSCGSYGRYNIFKTYTVLTFFFFIPTFRWGTQFYAQSTCCGALYALDKEIGKTVASGVPVEIKPEHLSLIRAGYVQQAQPAQPAQPVQIVKDVEMKKCSQCGTETSSDAMFCPSCGTKF